MTGNQIAKVLTAAIGAGVFAWIAFALFVHPRSIIEECSSVLKGTLQEGASLVPATKGSTSVQIGVLKTSEGVVGEDQRIAFIACIHSKDANVVDTRVILPPQPLGQIANRWRGERGIIISLMPLDAPEQLQNLRADDFSGEKYQFVRKICSPQGLAACITCDKTDITSETVQVEIRLRENAKLTREKYATAPPKTPLSKNEPFELVDESGNRFWYRCGS